MAREWRAGFYLPEGERHVAIERLSPDAPRELNHSGFEQVRVYFGENLDRLRQDSPVVAVHLEVAGIKDPAQIVTKLNGKILENGTIEGDALQYSLLPQMVRSSELNGVFRILQERVRYPVNPSILRNGLNQFEIRCTHENDPLALNDLFISLTRGQR